MSEFTPLPIQGNTIVNYSLEQLDSVLQNQTLNERQREMVVQELERKHLRAIAGATKALNSTTERLIVATQQVHQEVAILSSSSDRLETLTKKVKNLTWALFFLTLSAAIVPIGIEVWKAYHEPPTTLQTVPPKQGR
jgi:hypothetical protein